MKALLPWNWPALALQIAGLVLFLVSMHFIVLPWYYGREIKREQEIASAKAAAAVAAREADNAKIYKEATDAKNKTLEANLADANRAVAEFDSLQHRLRASKERVEADHSACIEYANTAEIVQQRMGIFAQRVSKAADGHALDAKTCTDAWPR